MRNPPPRPLSFFRAAAIGLLVVAGACSPPASRSGADNAAQAGEATAVADRARVAQPAVPARPAPPPIEPVGSPIPSPKYKDAAVPEAGAKCSFEEHDPAERPKEFISASHSSNIIFYQRPKGGPLWGDIDPDGATAELEAGELIVAARHGMPDLWIRPKGGRVTLQVGKRLTCL